MQCKEMWCSLEVFIRIDKQKNFFQHADRPLVFRYSHSQRLKILLFSSPQSEEMCCRTSNFKQ